MKHLKVGQRGASRTNLSAEAMIRLQFVVYWLCVVILVEVFFLLTEKQQYVSLI